MNALTNATVERAFLIDFQTVVFQINLASHVHLTNPYLVQISMDDYMRRYPNARAWSAKVSGGILAITVVGKLNQVNL